MLISLVDLIAWTGFTLAIGFGCGLCFASLKGMTQ